MTPRPRLILISGWAHDSSAMENLRQCLENAVEVSVAATGDLWSPAAAGRAPSAYARGLAQLIEKNGGKVFLAGWSLGGMIALETAAWRPEIADGLILISTTAKFLANENWTAGVSAGALRAMSAMLKRNPRRVFTDFFQKAACNFEEKIQGLGIKNRATAGLESIALKIERACAMNPLELSAGLEYLAETDLRSAAAQINIPALVLHGRHDAIMPVDAGLALKNILPASEINVYENCGHGLPWQNPRAIAGDIMEFLEKCGRRPGFCA
ncbi:MAG: alpha/beta fold hydrolase [Kiritimatiellae bacterium]|nr:alpha/beta fold hydrolase [Kiritimatiellia bacterium]